MNFETKWTAFFGAKSRCFLPRSPKFSQVSDSTFWEIMNFETKWTAFFGVKSRCFLPRLLSPAKAMRCADET